MQIVSISLKRAVGYFIDVREFSEILCYVLTGYFTTNQLLNQSKRLPGCPDARDRYFQY